MAEYIIQLQDLTKKYGSFTAVDRLNLNIRKGEIFGLLGPNGAGKSTTILMMLGLTEPVSGSVKVCGFDPVVNPIEVKRKVGYLPEDVGFYYNRSGFENLMFTARLNGISSEKAEEKVRKLLVRVGLSGNEEKKTGKYSRGMLQRLGLADVLIKNPEVIILDEPTLGIDPKGVRELLDLIVELCRTEGLTVLFSSHDLHQVQKVCDRVGIFVAGRLLAEGDVQTLSKKLFTGDICTVEVGLSAKADNGTAYDSEWLRSALKHIDCVTSVDINNEIFTIKCSDDATPDIARSITATGAGLIYLKKKVYGLDEIYYRYFEGGAAHE